jgi:excinuclease ABC subunit A
MDVIKTADWIVDLGPDGGVGGGQLVASGTPEQVAAEPTSYTGQFLGTVLKGAASRNLAKAASSSGVQAKGRKAVRA